MITIPIFPLTGIFAEDKDLARDMRINKIVPVIASTQEQLILDFTGVESTTQSFVHALLSDVIRTYGADVLERMSFKGCTRSVQEIITIVTEYMQI